MTNASHHEAVEARHRQHQHDQCEQAKQDRPQAMLNESRLLMLAPRPHDRPAKHRARARYALWFGASVKIERVDPIAGTEAPPANSDEERDGDVQQLVCDVVRAVEVEDWTEPEPVDDASSDGKDHDVEPQGSPEAAVAYRIDRKERGGPGPDAASQIGF